MRQEFVVIVPGGQPKQMAANSCRIKAGLVILARDAICKTLPQRSSGFWPTPTSRPSDIEAVTEVEINAARSLKDQQWFRLTA